MILGVRILSNNLSGLTANVTFLPVSGGTIDLGEQTIPFNYLNDNPYGTYQFYVPLYDYTYELVVNEPPVENNQSFATLSKITGTTTWCLGMLNFSDLTAEVISFELDSNDWDIDNTWYTNESGYVYFFYSNMDYNDKVLVFVDKFGNEVDRYSAYTDSYETNYLNYFGFGFIDYYNGIVKHFDGTNSMTFSFDKDNQGCEILNYEDFVTENRSILIRINTYSANTYTIYLQNSSGTTEIDTYDYTLFDKSYVTYKTGKFILNFNFDYTTGYYTDIKMLSQDDLSVLNSYTLSADTYVNNPYYSFYGKNKVFITFFNYYDNSVPYVLYYYNGDTDTSDLLIKPRGSEYINNQFFVSRAYENVNGDSGSFYMMFWDNDYDYSSLSGTTIAYMDIVYMVDGQESFTTYTYQDSGLPDKSMQIYGSYFSKSFYSIGNTGDGNLSVISISSDGVQYFPIEPYPVNKPLDRWIFGDQYIQMLWTDYSYTGGTFNLYSGNTLLDTMYFEKPNGWNYGYYHNVFYVTNFTDFYYINKTSNGFIQTNYYDFTYGGYNYWDETGHDYGRILFLNTSTGDAALLTEESFITGGTLPINGGNFDIRVGKDKFMYVYNTPTWLGNIIIELYDFDFNLLNSLETEFTYWNNTYGYKDRFVVEFNATGNKHITYLVSETIITDITTYDYNWEQINDYYWD